MHTYHVQSLALHQVPVQSSDWTKLEYTTNTVLFVAHSTAPSNNRTFAEVINISNATIFDQKGFTIGILKKCKRITYSVNKHHVNASSVKHNNILEISLTDGRRYYRARLVQTKPDSTPPQSLSSCLCWWYVDTLLVMCRTTLVEHHIDLKEGARLFQTSRASNCDAF